MPQHTEIFEVMFDLLLFFFVAGLVVPLLQRLKLSSILAYLICGMVIGPHGLSYLSKKYLWLKPFSIDDTSTVGLFGEFGIIALMFMIGLELSLKRLKELKIYVFGLGSSQIALTCMIIYFIARFFEYSVQASVLIGASMALSSTAIVMHLLEEQRLNNQVVGVLSFSILLMQDLAVVPILVLASSFSPHSNENVFLLFTKSIFLAITAIILIYVMGRWLLRPILNIVSTSRNPEWLSSFIVFIIIACASITIFAGLSAALGAFLAGLLIAETEFRYEVEVIIKPLKSLFLGFFFMSIGMNIDIMQAFQNPLKIFLSVIVLFLVKTLSTFLVARLFKINNKNSIQTSIFLAQPGEFALMIIGVAFSSKIISFVESQFFLLVISISMILTPLFFKFAPWVSSIFINKNHMDENLTIEPDEKLVIIAGFGRIGQLVGGILEKQRVPYIAIDHDAHKVQVLREQGFRVIYGDAKKIKLWKLINTKLAIAVAITIDDQNAALAILSSIRAKWPLLPIIIRANDIGDINNMQDLGANYVVPETLESSLRIARLLMEELRIEQSIIDKSIEEAWSDSCFLEKQKTSPKRGFKDNNLIKI